MSRNPAATSMAKWPRRRGISGRARTSLAGHRESVISVLAQRPLLRASKAATGSTKRAIDQAIHKATKDAIANSGVREGEILSDEQIRHLTGDIVNGMMPFLTHNMRVNDRH